MLPVLQVSRRSQRLSEVLATSAHTALADAAGPAANGRPLERVPTARSIPRTADRSHSTRDRFHPEAATPAPSRASDLATPSGQPQQPNRSTLAWLLSTIGGNAERAQGADAQGREVDRQLRDPPMSKGVMRPRRERGPRLSDTGSAAVRGMAAALMLATSRLLASTGRPDGPEFGRGALAGVERAFRAVHV